MGSQGVYAGEAMSSQERDGESFQDATGKQHDVTMMRLDELKGSITGLRDTLIGQPSMTSPTPPNVKDVKPHESGLLHVMLDRQRHIDSRINELLYIVSEIRHKL